MASQSDPNFDKILVTINKYKPVPSSVNLQSKSSASDSNVKKDKLEISEKEIFSYVVQTKDNLGNKDYANIKLTKVDSVTSDPGLLNVLENYGGGRHMFFENLSKTRLKSSFSLLAEGNHLRYYFNHEGKLSLKEKTSKESKKMKNEHCKIHIALEILDIIFSKIGTDTKRNGIDDQLNMTDQVGDSSTLEEKFNTFEEESLTIKRSKEEIEKYTLEHKVEGVNILAKQLKLPIKTFRSRQFLDPRAKVEPILNVETFASNDTESFSTTKTARSVTSQINQLGSSVTNVSDAEESFVESPFEPRWCFGFNSEVQIVNLSTEKRSVVLFANSQFPVLYDFHEDTMRFLQGHKNMISCLGRNSTGSILVTADTGPDSRVILWDSRPCAVQVLENVHPRGTIMSGLSSSGKYLVTVSPPPLPILQLWMRSEDNLTFMAEKSLIESFGEVVELVMNPNCEEEFSLTFHHGVFFFYFNKEGGSEKEQLLCTSLHQPPGQLGRLTDTTYMDKKAIALSATSKGYVIVWVEKDKMKHTKQHDKHVRFDTEEITHIEVVDGHIAIATVSGNIRFYDSSLKFLWASKEQFGTLVTLSFNLNSEVKDVSQTVCELKHHSNCAITWRQEIKHSVDATLQSRHLKIRQLVFCTKSGKMAYFNPTEDVPKYVFYQSNAMYTAIDVMPQSSYICAGTSLGTVILLNFHDCQIKVSKQLPVNDSSCKGVSFLRYSSSGHLLACAMYSGELWLLDPLVLTPHPEMPLTQCVDCITHVIFSRDSDYLAVADMGMCVTVYFLANPPQLVGQYQAHSKAIRDIIFFLSADDLHLLTLGADRNVVEFEITKGEEDTTRTLKFVNIYRVEQTAIPYCIVPYLPDEKYYLMVNSEMKFKLLEKELVHCCKTIQAPILGSPIKFMKCFKGNGQPYLLFGTNHEVGLHILPPDGNPYKALAYRVSPTRIICSTIYPEENYMFTISEDSSAINMWQINTMAVEQYCAHGGTGLTPFLSLLECGKGDWLEMDLQEFFFFAQFIHQGERPDLVRTLSKSLQVCEVIFVFQALGFFPTKYQIENVLYEILGPDTSCKQQANSSIAYDEFVKLFVNHRPCQELTTSDLRQAFHDFYEGVYFSYRDISQLKLDYDPVFNTESFFENLIVTGEATSPQELYTYLSILVGDKLEYLHDHGVSITSLPLMPQEMTFGTLFTTLLGFQNNNNL